MVRQPFADAPSTWYTLLQTPEYQVSIWPPNYCEYVPWYSLPITHTGVILGVSMGRIGGRRIASTGGMTSTEGPNTASTGSMSSTESPSTSSTRSAETRLFSGIRAKYSRACYLLILMEASVQSFNPSTIKASVTQYFRALSWRRGGWDRFLSPPFVQNGKVANAEQERRLRT